MQAHKSYRHGVRGLLDRPSLSTDSHALVCFKQTFTPRCLPVRACLCGVWLTTVPLRSRCARFALMRAPNSHHRASEHVVSVKMCLPHAQ